MKYGHYKTYDEIKNDIDKILKGMDDEYIDKIEKELSESINYQKITTQNHYMNI